MNENGPAACATGPLRTSLELRESAIGGSVVVRIVVFFVC